MILEDEYFDVFVKCGTKKRYNPSEIIYMQEDDSGGLYLITKGEVRVFDITPSGKEITYDVLTTGNIFGESSCFSGSPRPATVEALAETEVVSCNLENLYPYIEKSGKLAVALMHILVERCDRTMNLLKIAYTYDRYEKVAAFLYDKSAEGNVITYTHEEISTCVGLSRVAVTKVLKEMEDAGFIENQYRKVKVIKREELREKYLKC